MKPWVRIEPTIATKIDYHDVIVKTFRLPDDNLATRATLLSTENRSAGIIALTKDNMVIVARQFRPGPEKIVDDIPGGRIDIGEEVEAAARRELLEETGYRPGTMVYLGEFDRGGYVNGKSHYYFATDCEFVSKQALDHDEFISVELRTIPEFIAAVKEGGMSDPFAVLVAYDQLMEIQNKEANT